ncbi:sodium:solute symporter [Rapidithrix thailandica]|uniref:Sodium:solute symporter n=1 Tax=Rapidithrix thailandica TaxID=413964 RepID=A0AAW9S2M9_9BACT
MSTLDWTVLLGTLGCIVIYGVWKTRGSKNIQEYLLGDKSMSWGTIGLSVMATQASAITFLSTPGQAYESGMAFVQNYFGLPIALVIISAVFIPLYYRLKVYTAYEFLEKRFDLRTRLLGAFLFLLQRGLAAGITIYAPAIILSSILHWNLDYTILFVGILVIIYTVSGGTKAVSLTQKYQMGVIMLGMFTAFFLIIQRFPEYIGFMEAVKISGKMGKLEVVDLSFDYTKRYTLWSGLTGGLFLALSYFGTDQSQVQRYISGKNITASRLGLMFNAMLKIPMQFFILLVGVMVFIFYQFEKPPVFFKEQGVTLLQNSEYAEQFSKLDAAYSENFQNKKEQLENFAYAMNNGSEEEIQRAEQHVKAIQQEGDSIRSEVKALLKTRDIEYETKDSDYVFLTFIMKYMPEGIIGLLLAVIFSAAMSSTSGELNALGSTTTVDFYKRIVRQNGSEQHYLVMSKMLTAFWGVMAIVFAFLAKLAENLIEMVNILGSVFYGTILGIFLIAFFMRFIRGNAVFISAILAQMMVFILFATTDIGYLWYNAIGCGAVMIFSLILQPFLRK